MLTYTWKPRNIFIDSTSVITLEDMLGKPIAMGTAPVYANGQITVTVPSEGSYKVRVKTKNTNYAYRINVNDPANDTPTPSTPSAPLPGDVLRVVVHNGTAYPARPAGVPAGMVRYVGPVAPSSALADDEWFDTSVVVPDTTAPSAVTNLVAGTATTTSIPLTWSAATDAVGVTGYEYSTNGTSYTSTGSTGTSYTVTGLTASTAYTLYVRAFDAAGNRGPAASVAKTTAAPAVVSLKDQIIALSPTLFAPLDDAAGTTAPVNLGSNGATLQATGTFGNAGIGGGTAAWSGIGTVSAPAATLDGTSVNSGFAVIRAGAAITSGRRPFGAPDAWNMDIAELSGGAETGIGMLFSDSVAFYASSGYGTRTVGQTFTVGWSMDATSTRFYLNGALTWTGAATTMKSSTSRKNLADQAQTTTRQYASALWSGTALTAAQHLNLAKAAGVAV